MPSARQQIADCQPSAAQSTLEYEIYVDNKAGRQRPEIILFTHALQELKIPHEGILRGADKANFQEQSE
jgi:hypothetical protein